MELARHGDAGMRPRVRGRCLAAAGTVSRRGVAARLTAKLHCHAMSTTAQDLDRGVALPPARPVLWPLRPLASAAIHIDERDDGSRHIEIRHAVLAGVTQRMLTWWYGHIDGDMEYAGGVWPRYLVWHPLDHIAYAAVRVPGHSAVSVGARLHLQEALQREPSRRLDLPVNGERLDEAEATISRQVGGRTVMRLVNRFEAVSGGTRCTSRMTIGLQAGSHAMRRLVNRVLRAKVLPGAMATHWVQHHIEEVGNLENFLPSLDAAQAGSRRRNEPAVARGHR
jgi:hypothetical protein